MAIVDLGKIRRKAGQIVFNRCLKPPLPPSARLKPYEGDFGTGYHWEELFCQSSPDIQSAVSLCEGSLGPILDLGGGAGRLSLALAEKGYSVLLVDKSETMLALAKARREKLGARLRQHFEIRRQDIVQLNLGITSDRIFALSNILDHLGSEEECLAALTGIREHLSPDGSFHFDAVRPEFWRHRPDWHTGKWIYTSDVRLPSKRLRVWGRTVPGETNGHSVVEYAVSSGLFSYVHMRTPLRLLTIEQWHRLFALTRLEVTAVRGGWSGEPLGEDSPSFVFTLRRE